MEYKTEYEKLIIEHHYLTEKYNALFRSYNIMYKLFKDLSEAMEGK